MYVCVYVYVCRPMCVCIGLLMYVCMYVSVRMCIRTCYILYVLSMCVFMYVCIYVYACALFLILIQK